MGVVFLVSGFACYITSLLQGYSDQEKAIDISGINFKTEKSFNISTVIICIILTIIYVLLW
jgi:SSS family solute:Na+ symporter